MGEWPKEIEYVKTQHPSTGVKLTGANLALVDSHRLSSDKPSRISGYNEDLDAHCI